MAKDHESPNTERRFSQEQYDFLKECSEKGEEGIKEWNEWRKNHAKKPVLLEDASLSGVYLQDADLRDACLAGSDFSDADASQARFYRAHLLNAVFDSTRLEGAVFSEAELKIGAITSVCKGWPREQKFNSDQHEILVRCSESTDISEWNNWRASHPEEPILLEGAELSSLHLEGAMFDTGEHSDFKGEVRLHDANFNDTHLEEARFHEAHMERVNLWGAHVQKADFFRTHLECANLEDSYWEGTYLEHANLQGARCRGAVVSSYTLLYECRVDPETDFSEVALNSMRIDPRTRQLLEHNMRRKNWTRWYGSHSVLRWPVRLFWWISDYGLSTSRIIVTFFSLAGAFAVIYANLEYYLPPGAVSDLTVKPHLPIWHYFAVLVLRPIYFSVVTMTTLGFGDMYAHSESILGHILLTLQVLLGYMLLGALVTRFAVLFTAGGPAGRFSEGEASG